MMVRILSALICLCIALGAARATELSSLSGQVKKDASLLFTENRGQVVDADGHLRPNILFTAHSNGAKVFLTANGIHYQFTTTEYPAGYEQNDRVIKDPLMQERLREQIVTRSFRFTLSLTGADPHPRVYSEEQNQYTESFYLAHCPAGITDVHTFGRIVYKDVYPGIDWVICSKGNGIKYDFVVHPGADPALIQLSVTDADGVSISKKGELVMRTALGSVKEAAPVSYCGDQTVATHFVQNGTNRFRFALNSYDRTKTLTIDPSVSWSTYYGAAADDYVNGCATDAAGNVFIVGETTSSTGLSSSGSYQAASAGSVDAFIVKFNSAGSRLWGTFYGGTGAEHATSCAVDSSNGSLYVGGYTGSASGIASGGFQNTASGGLDGYLVKFNSVGSRIWGTYYGGASGDNVYSCAVDRSGNVYIAGQTLSNTGIAANGYQNAYANISTFDPYGDAFLAKFNSAGGRIWGTYYGGTGGDLAMSCAVDKNNNVFLAGYGYSTTGISSTNGFQTAIAGAEDAFLVKFDSASNRLWGTYYGGTGGDFAYTCTVDRTGNVYLGGITPSTSGIASNGFQNTYGGSGAGGDAFLVKFNPAGSRLWGTYYGGTGVDKALFSATDSLGNVYVGGQTSSFVGIASNGFQNALAGTNDAYIAKFDSTGSRLWGSYFGGTGNEIGTGCSVNATGSVIYMSGHTGSSAGIANNGFQNTYGGNSFDGFLLKINDAPPATISTTSAAPLILCAGSNLSVTYTLSGTFTSGNTFTVQLSDALGSFAAPINIGTITGTTSGSISSVIPAGTIAGTGYRVRIVASMPAVTGMDNGTNISIAAAPLVTVTQAGNVLTATPGFVTYAWYRNGVLIAGATGTSYTPTQNGSYTVVVTNASQCSATSLPVSYISAGIAGVAGVPGLRVYPNPVKNMLVLDFSATTLLSAGITITDMTDRSVYRSAGFLAGNRELNIEYQYHPVGKGTICAADK